jgi:hypothetical protein
MLRANRLLLLVGAAGSAVLADCSRVWRHQVNWLQACFPNPLDKINVYVYSGAVGRVLTFGRFAVYVYAESGAPHHLPHCNVRWPDGDAQVGLPTLGLIAGTALPRGVLRFLSDNLPALIAEWNRLNPGRQI